MFGCFAPDIGKRLWKTDRRTVENMPLPHRGIKNPDITAKIRDPAGGNQQKTHTVLHRGYPDFHRIYTVFLTGFQQMGKYERIKCSFCARNTMHDSVSDKNK